MPAVPSNTTLSSALDAKQTTVSVTDASITALGEVLVIGAEMMLVNAAPDTSANRVQVQRGYGGTRAVKHKSGSIVYSGKPNEFEISRNDRIAVKGYTGDLAEMELPLGTEYFDPDTGNTYVLVDCGATFINGEWVVIDGSFLATQLAILSKGRVGIVTETPGASDQLAWVLVRGTYSSACFDSDVTTGMELGAAAGFAAPYDSTNHMLIHRATCTVAPSTATSPTVGDGLGTAYIDRPWVSGVATFVS